MNNDITQIPPPTGLMVIINRAATDPNFDIDKMQRLLDMIEADAQRTERHAFAEALTAAEAEMDTVRTDMTNPQTRSRYASFAQLDRAVRPIYTRHGFALSFTTEPMNKPDSIMVVCTLSHRQGHSRRIDVPVPITTTGFQGKAMMTPVHAMMAAISYGKRNAESMAFNLQVGDTDDDGNGPRRTAPPLNQARTQQERPPMEVIDEASGEITRVAADTSKINPCKITWIATDDWRSWGEKLMWGVRKSESVEEIDQWLKANHERLTIMETDKIALYRTLTSAVNAVKEGLLQ